MSTTSFEGILACSIVLPILSIATVGLRFHARSVQKANLKFDDWAQVPALLFFIGMAIIALIGVANKAFGYPPPPGPPTLTAPSTILCQKLIFAIQIVQILALALIKNAALFFYKRIFCTHALGLLHSAIWGLTTLIIAWAVTFITFYASTCGTHPNAAWDGFAPFARYCIITERFEEAYAITDFVLDFLVLIVPLPSIWSLRMGSGRKIAITGVLMLALIGVGASIARTAIFINLATGKGAATRSPSDIQAQNTQAIWFSMLETGLALIAVNLPSLWGLISHLSPDSLLHSIRSLLSIRSHTSSIGGFHSFNKHTDNRYQRKGSDAASQHVELVASPNHVNSAHMAKQDMQSRDHTLEDGNEVDLEIGMEGSDIIESSP